ncbi:MAG: hypothetical protein EF813_01980 [Methanosarcinales archaeon]|nr:MAG: hypothetical protein EF813_01980 [Methanosarcinales archaeon]
MSETNKRVQELIKRMYALGYNVGYHHHSEIGWVSDTYNTLAGQTKDDRLKNLLRQYYIKGKDNGKKRRKHDIQGRSTKKTETNKASELFDENASQVSAADTLFRQPDVLDIPNIVMQTTLIDLPANLRGFRLI